MNAMHKHFWQKHVPLLNHYLLLNYYSFKPSIKYFICLIHITQTIDIVIQLFNTLNDWNSTKTVWQDSLLQTFTIIIAKNHGRDWSNAIEPTTQSIAKRCDEIMHTTYKVMKRIPINRKYGIRKQQKKKKNNKNKTKKLF